MWRYRSHFGTCDQILLSEICRLVSVERPLWREVGTVICHSQSVVIYQYVHKAFTLNVLYSSAIYIYNIYGSRSRYFTTDGQSVSRSVCLGVGHPLGAHDQILLFSFFCLKITLLFDLGRPLWREYGSVICSAIYQWSELLRTQPYITVSSETTGFPFRRLLRLAGITVEVLLAASAREYNIYIEVEVTLRLTVSQYVLVSNTLMGLATRYYFLAECWCLKFAVLYLWGALSDERTGLQFAV
jgi:hypothetical protein